jgi:DnaK suppressor protein
MTERNVQLKEIEQTLRSSLSGAEQEIEELDQQVRSFGESGELAEGLDNHPGDDSDGIAEQERLLTIRNRLNERKSEIEYALTKIDKQEFGRCERCNREIPSERLEALPFARYCVDCQEVLDREAAAAP